MTFGFLKSAASAVVVEKSKQGEESLRAFEEVASNKYDTLISAKIGSSNAMEPIITVAQVGLPVIEGDGMGRAFPKVKMCTWFIYGTKRGLWRLPMRRAVSSSSKIQRQAHFAVDRNRSHRA